MCSPREIRPPNLRSKPTVCAVTGGNIAELAATAFVALVVVLPVISNSRIQRRTEYWRREWDSNPRYGFPHTRFPSVRLKPLGHLSEEASHEGARGLLQVTAGTSAAISTTH